MKPAPAHPGITLIELLIERVFPVLLFAAILYPVFAQAREKSRAIDCMSNMKKLAGAISMYRADYDDAGPNGLDWQYPGGSGWAGQIYPYLGSIERFYCRDDNRLAQCSYGYNSDWTAPTGRSVTGFKLSACASPANTILLFEVEGNIGAPNAPWTVANETRNHYGDGGFSPAGWGVSGSRDHPSWALSGAGASSSTPTLKMATGYLYGVRQIDHPAYADPGGRHEGGANYVFADGHAKWLKPVDVSPGVTNPYPQNCGGLPDSKGAPMAANSTCAGVHATFSLK